jgi:hypothetical protein
MEISRVKQHDVSVIFTDTLEATGLTDLNDVDEIVFVLRHVSGSPAVAGTASIVSSVERTVRYVAQSGDLDTAGVYRQEWEVTFDDGAVLTFPSDGYNMVEVLADLYPVV